LLQPKREIGRSLLRWSQRILKVSGGADYKIEFKAEGLGFAMQRRCPQCVMSLNDSLNAVNWLLIFCFAVFDGLWQVQRKRTRTETCLFTLHVPSKHLLR